MKKVLLGFLLVFAVLVGIMVWKGNDIVNALFYDMDATMDLPANLYDDKSLTETESSSEEDSEEEDIYLADVTEYLSLRDAPNQDSDVVAQLAPLTQMELISEASYPFLLVYVPSIDKEGYVHRDYIAKQGETLKRATPEE
jgi:hypothetical protein